MVILIIILILLLVAFIAYKFNLRHVPLGCATMINGGIKSGKSLMCVDIAISKHKKALFFWRLKKYILCWFVRPKRRKQWRNQEKPLLYSNIPLDYKYFVPLTNDLLRRKERFAYKSVTYIGEVSLVANSMSYNDLDLNEDLEMFIKLYGHETHNGYLLIDTQALADNHYAIKRSIDSTLWIERNFSLPILPFHILKVKRMVVCNENTANIYEGDKDSANDLYHYLIWKNRYHNYDYICYSIFTDSLPVNDKIVHTKFLKQPHPPSFRKFRRLGK